MSSSQFRSDFFTRYDRIIEKYERLSPEEVLDDIIIKSLLHEASDFGEVLLNLGEKNRFTHSSVNAFYRIHLTGYSADELTRISFPKIVHPDDKIRIERGFEAIIAEKEVESTYRSILIHKDGTEIPVEISVGSFDYKGPQFGLIVKDRRGMEKLETKILELEKLAWIGTLTAQIGHSFNNKLGSIYGFLDFLMVRGNLPDEIKRQLQIPFDDARSAKVIVSELLSVARKPKQEKSNINLKTLLDGVYEQYKPLYAEKGIRFSLDYGTDLPRVRGYPDKLRDAIQNLLINAEHAVLNNGRNEKYIQLSCRFEGGYNVIEILDNGYGIPSDVESKLFEPFFTTKKGGTGLGLFTIKGAMVDHGGKIKMKTKEGEGTIFKLYLPTGPTTDSITKQK